MINSWTQDINTRFIFFTGKGGVGKTSLACSLAVKLADAGKRVLIISTDPASNLDEVFATKLSNSATAIEGVDRLAALNIDPEAAASAYREKMIGPYRGKLPDAVLRNIEEQFSGSCTTEIAAFDEFVKLLSNVELNQNYDHLIFDTAPTGHTLRLLSLPGAWTAYLNTTTADSSCLGPLAGLQDQRAVYEKAIHELSDSQRCTIVLVARPDRSSLKEAARAQIELADLGLRNASLIINAVFSEQSEDPIAQAYAESVAKALAQIPASLNNIPQYRVPLLLVNTVGITALRELAGTSPSSKIDPSTNQKLPITSSLEHLIAEMAEAGHGVILTMGKGGVGKTYVAVEIASRLAQMGKKVLLTTTDPAGNVADVAKSNSNLVVDKIDPQIEIQKYTNEAIKRSEGILDQEALELLKEDLRSPCTEEIAVFRAFAEVVAKGQDQFVVIDTAPTGHTILLMDATESYHREVLRTNSAAPESVKNLLPKLRDPDYTKVIIVALPEPTPVHEAAKLQADLNRAGIKPFAWIINRSLLASGTKDKTLMQRAAQELGPINEAIAKSTRTSILPWIAQ